MPINSKKKDSLLFRGFQQEICIILHSYHKKTSINPSWLIMSIIGRLRIIRKLVKLFTKKNKLQRYNLAASAFDSVNIESAVQSLQKEGYWEGIKLPKHLVNHILQFTITGDCYGNSNPRLGFKVYQKKQAEQKCQLVFNKAEYFNSSSRCPIIRELSTDPLLLEIARQYLQTKPVFTGSRLWWIFPVDDSSYDPRKTVSYFHYDLDDYSCVRFFFYLTDVDSNSGPHICVRGSHRNKKLNHVLSPFKRRTDKDIASYYGNENIITICGEAGFGFAEDTIAYHKAARPLTKSRLILQLQYAINDYGNHNDLKDEGLLKNVV